MVLSFNVKTIKTVPKIKKINKIKKISKKLLTYLFLSVIINESSRESD